MCFLLLLILFRLFLPSVLPSLTLSLCIIPSHPLRTSTVGGEAVGSTGGGRRNFNLEWRLTFKFLLGTGLSLTKVSFFFKRITDVGSTFHDLRVSKCFINVALIFIQGAKYKYPFSRQQVELETNKIVLKNYAAWVLLSYCINNTYIYTILNMIASFLLFG